MVIKAVSTSVVAPIVQVSTKALVPSGIFKLQGSGDVFVKSNKTSSQLESEIEKVKESLQTHKKEYNSLRNKLNKSFGDDWVFCYGDLTDKESDMYIDCIAERSVMTRCEQIIAKLGQELELLKKHT